MAKKKPKRSYTTTTLDSSGYIEGGGVRALPHNLWVDIKRNKVLYVCLTFILAFFVIFSFLPLVGLLMAFERYSPVKGFFGSQWVGLQNFETFFSGPYVGRLIRNTLAIGVLNLVVNFPAPIIFALILNEIKNKYFKKIVQTISYMPYFVSAVVACGIVVDFTEAGGAISTFVASITGSEPQNLLNQGTNFWLIYVLQNMWQGLGYKALIDEGAETVMVGHIYQPAMTRKINPSLQEKDMLPGSTSKELVAGVLRGQLGFQGLVVTDATPMVGFSMALSRANALVAALNAGVDMLLFCKNMEEDIGSIREALQDGRLSWKRVEEAVTRILATKAHLGLPEKRKLGTLFPGNMSVLGCEKHQAWAKECAEKAVTLVKDNQNLLPISPKKTPRIRLTVLGEGKTGSFGESSSVAQPLKAALERAGFLVSLFDYATLEQGEIFTAGVGDLKGKFDLSIVVANVATGSNNTTRRLDWVTLMAADEPWYTRDIPTLFVSFCNPYHMIDVPFISTFVNCYCDNQATVEACVKKLIGRDIFVGKSPIDPWCGVWGARFL